jgi:cell division septal protein FtsQ
MFTNKNKKPDSKIRFQHQSFQNRLESARNYKRQAKKIPQNSWEIFLARAGLRSFWAKAVLLVLLLSLIYIVYIPNFLTVKHIEIVGLKQEDSEVVKDKVKDFLNKNVFLPQKNFLLLSKGKLSNFVQVSSDKVLKVENINKDFPNKVKITVKPRISSIAMEVLGERFLVSNDGLVTEKIEMATTSPLNMVFLKFKEGETPSVGNKYLSQELVEKLKEIYKQTQNVNSISPEYFELLRLNEPDIYLYSKNGSKLVFDVKLEIGNLTERLKLLLGQIADQDENNIFYIDLRFKNRAFVCFKGTACVRDIIINRQPTATSTEETLEP